MSSFITLEPPSPIDVTPLTLDLIFPPLTGVSYPYLSTAALSAFVKANSVHSVQQLDLNLRFVESLLTPDAVMKNIADAEAQLAAFAGSELDGRQIVTYGRCVELLLRGPAIVEALPAALDTVRAQSLGAVSPAVWQRADQIIALALDSATVLRAPERYNFTEPVYRYSSASPSELLDGVNDRDNGFYRFYDSRISEEELRGDIIGISIVYRGQVLPSLALAQWLKENRKGARVIAGGPLFTANRKEIMADKWLFELFDAIILYEGERPLVSYLNAVGAGASLENLPAILRLDSTAQVCMGPRIPPVPADELPTPDFDGLQIGRYHSCETILPLLASRGCYWRCAFCTHHHIYGDSYRVRADANLARDLIELESRYGCRHVYFVDESISPKLLRHISDTIISYELDVRWGCELRLERGLRASDFRQAFRSGCRVFSFGLESANQRVLDRMNKGIKRREAERILGEAHEAGIHNHVMCIIGFPGETEDEALETIEFIDEYQQYLDIAGFSFFCLNRYSPVHMAPEAFGVKNVRQLAEGHTWEERLAYEVVEGIDREQAFGLWERAESSSGAERLRNKVGHSERERFLFSSHTQKELDASELTDSIQLSPLIDRLPLVVRSFDRDILEALGAAGSFYLRAGRAYNVSGQSLATAWLLEAERFVSRESGPKEFIYVPRSDRIFELSREVVDLLISIQRGSLQDSESLKSAAAVLAGIVGR